jgi:hypothetical protein
LGIEVKSERLEVTAAVVALELRTFARQRWPLENDKSRKELLRKAMRPLYLTARRIKSLYEGEETAVPRGSETARIEELIGHKIGAAAEGDADAVKHSQENYRLLEARIAQLEAIYARLDPEHVGEQVAAFRAQAHGHGEGPGGGGGGNGPAGNAEPGDFSD